MSSYDLSIDKNADLSTAARLASRAVALAPNEAFSHFARASVLQHYPDRLEEALSATLRVLAIDPNHTEARAHAGFTLLLLGRPEEAEPYFEAALKAEPEHIGVPTWLNRMGLAELFLDRYQQGAEYFRRAIARQSETNALGDVGLEREINLAAALALGGDVEAGRHVIERLHRRYPPLSTNNIWNCGCSNAPRFKAGVEKLRKGAALAGLTSAD